MNLLARTPRPQVAPARSVRNSCCTLNASIVCSVPQGDATERDALARLMHAVKSDTCITVRLTNYTKRRERFVHELSVEPLRDPAGITRCFQATSLVLLRPGQASADLPSIVSRAPTYDGMLPALWPLLGRAVRPLEEMYIERPAVCKRASESAEDSAEPGDDFCEESSDLEVDILDW